MFSQGANGAKARRVWSMYGKTDIANGPETSFQFAYNTEANIVENVIGMWDQDSLADASNPYGMVFIADEGTNHKLLGSIMLVRSNDLFEPSRIVVKEFNPGIQIKDVVVYSEQSNKKPFSLNNDNCVLANANCRLDNTTEIGGGSSSIGSNWVITNRVDVDTVDRAPSIWNGSGSNGARACRRYVNGTLTSTPLWPWPMNQRIIDAMRTAGKAAVDVTRTMEEIFGPIPSECRTSVVANTTSTPMPTTSVPTAPTSLSAR
jgi:hypothetical protein